MHNKGKALLKMGVELGLLMGLSLAVSGCQDIGGFSAVGQASTVNGGSAATISLTNPLQIDLPQHSWISSSPPHVMPLAISSDGKYIAAQGERDLNEGVFVWQLSDGKLVSDNTGLHANNFLSFVPNTHHLVTDKPVIWDVDSQKTILQQDQTKGIFYGQGRTNPLENTFDDAATISHDGSMIFGGPVDSGHNTSNLTTPGLWDTNTGKLLQELDIPPASLIEAGVFNSEDTQIIVTEQPLNQPDNIILTVWDTKTGQKLDQWQFEFIRGHGLYQISPDGTLLELQNTKDGQMDGFWDVKSHTRLARLPTGFVHPDFITPDNKYSVTFEGYAGNGTGVAIFSIPSGQVVAHIPAQYIEQASGSTYHQPQDQIMQSVAMSDDGKYIATAGNRSILVWSLAELEGK